MIGFSDMRQSRHLGHQDSTTVSRSCKAVPVDVAPAGGSQGDRAVARAVPREGDSLERKVARDVDGARETPGAEHPPDQPVLARREPQMEAAVVTLAHRADVPV